MSTRIGTAHGADAWLAWMKRAHPDTLTRSPTYDPAKPETWPWPERFARTLRALAVDHDSALEADPDSTPPATLASIFAQPGWFAVRYDALLSPAQLAAAGVKWVAATLSHGANADGSHNNDADDQTNQAWLAAGKAQAYRDAGIKVGGWGWHEVQPEIEAVIAATHIESFKLDFWIANAEAVWKPDDQRFVANGPERYCKRLAIELALRGLPAAFPVGWSVLGAAAPPNVFGYDYAAFTRRGWRILPQAYPQQSLEYKLSTVIDHAAKAGIPLGMLHPTIANYRPQKPQAYQPTLTEWVNELRAARVRGVIGFSVWAHDWTVDDVRKLVSA